MAHQRREGGFSLLEILLVVLLTATILAIAVPGIESALGTYRLRNAVDDIYSQIGMARMRAIGDFAHARLVCSPATNSCQIDLQKEGGSYEPEGGDVYLPSGVSFGFGSIANGAGNQSAGAPAQDLTIYFNSRGIPIDSTGANYVSDYVIYLQSTADQRYYAIGIAADGKPSIYRYGAGSWVMETE